MDRRRILPADRWEPFSDEHLARVVPVATARVVRGSAASDFTARQAELVVFDVSGMSDDGVRIWHSARRLGEAANARARALARHRHGGRASGVGWIGWVLVLAAIAGALAGGVALSSRDAVVSAVLSAASALLMLVAAVGARGRPLDRALWRPHAFALAGSVAAVAIVAGRAEGIALAVLVAAPVVLAASLIASAVVRAVRPQLAHEVDDGLTSAYRSVIADLPAHVQRLVDETAAALPPERARFIERARAAVFENALSDERMTERGRARLGRHGDVHVAGGVIIADFADPLTWMPEPLARSAYTADDPRHPDRRDG